MNHDDRDWLFNKLKSCVKDHFNEQFEVALDSVQTSSGEVKYVLYFITLCILKLWTKY